ncbi:hypothetical protein C2S51_006704 [Perilla frutescens var. frutescens]|nr:hypothetical protein C2S51_006704 [Perilla frutescens var. frutescens]
MCYPYLVGDSKSATPRRQLVTFPAEEAARQPPQGGGLAEGDGGGGRGGGGIVKMCLCSPTSHPGSFRCRLHHGEYQWVNNRLGAKPS